MENDIDKKISVRLKNWNWQLRRSRTEHPQLQMPLVEKKWSFLHEKAYGPRPFWKRWNSICCGGGRCVSLLYLKITLYHILLAASELKYRLAMVLPRWRTVLEPSVTKENVYVNVYLLVLCFMMKHLPDSQQILIIQIAFKFEFLKKKWKPINILKTFNNSWCSKAQLCQNFPMEFSMQTASQIGH